jgi:hypothetical protein
MYRGCLTPQVYVLYIYRQGAQCNTSHALYPILHGITSLDSNSTPPASTALVPPSGRSISAEGSAAPLWSGRADGPTSRGDSISSGCLGATSPRRLPRASGPALPRGCGGSTRGRQAAAPLEPLGSSGAAGRCWRPPSESAVGTGCSGASSHRPGLHAPPPRRALPSVASGLRHRGGSNHLAPLAPRRRAPPDPRAGSATPCTAGALLPI